MVQCRYAAPLAECLEPRGWKLVQPLFSSSYGGWGTSCLNQDADELLLLLQYLKMEQDSVVITLFHPSLCYKHRIFVLCQCQRVHIYI